MFLHIHQKITKQTFGLPMGFLISRILAYLFLDFHELNKIQNKLPPNRIFHIYRWYSINLSMEKKYENNWQIQQNRKKNSIHMWGWDKQNSTFP